jgi:diguanylate cyclase (GGDEF)-like protein/PAS domain S-box-containing protein
MDNDLFRRLIKQSAEAMAVTDARARDHPVVFVNPAFEALTGYTRDELLSRNCRFLQNHNRDQPYRHLMRTALNHGDSVMGMIENVRKDGSRFWNLIGLSPIRDEAGELTHYLGVMRDISEFLIGGGGNASPGLNVFGEQLAWIIGTDALTGIANRGRFDEILGREWGIAKRHGDALALAMIDIDNFKPFNDHYGHPAGDKCLQRVAGTIERHFQRAGDLVARYGGEEFVVLSPRQPVAVFAKKVEDLRAEIEALAIPSGKGAAAPVVTVSAGVAALRPRMGVAPGALVEAADRAMYQAKKDGRNRVFQAAGTDDARA